MTSYAQLSFENERHEEESRADTLVTMLHILGAKGHRVEQAVDEYGKIVRKSYKYRMKKIAEALNEEERQRIKNAPHINEAEYKRLKLKSDIIGMRCVGCIVFNP